MSTQIKNQEFLAKIIHDLKTPTIAQIKALELFLSISGDKLSKDEKELIELTLNSCNYMKNLIDTYGAVNKLEHEQLRLNYTKFDIVDLIKKIKNETSILLKYEDLKIELNLPKELIVNADILQIRRVIENIISNCINYSFKGTTIYIEAKKTKGRLIVEVKNTSPYIKPEQLKKIFEKFKSYSSGYDKCGLGLGLYLSKEIINAHFGNMLAKSYKNNTNIFGFEIPLN